MTLQWTILKRTARRWWDDNALRLSASLSYYTLFSLAPMLIIVIAVAGMIFGQDAVEGRLIDEIQGLVGHDSAIAIQSMIQHAREQQVNATATFLSLTAMIVLSTGVFVELQDALNLIWRIQPESTSALAFLAGPKRTTLFLLSRHRHWVSSRCVAGLERRGGSPMGASSQPSCLVRKFSCMFYLPACR